MTIESDMMGKAKAKYETLRDLILEEIDRIDHETPWRDTEPKWWLDMMEIERLVRTKKQT